MNRHDELKEKEWIQQLKLLSFSIYMIALLFLGYYILFSDTITIYGSQLYGFSKWLWFFVVDFTICLSVTLIIGSFSILVSMHVYIINIEKRVSSNSILLYSLGFLVFGYLILYGSFYFESYIRGNARSINRFFADTLYRYELIEFLIHAFFMVACICVTGFFSVLTFSFMVLPFRIKTLINKSGWI